MTGRKRICPKCGSSNAAKIVYGYPSSQLIESLERGEIVLGGCSIDIDSPTIRCLDCDYEWGGKPYGFLSEMCFLNAYVGGHFGPSYSLEVNHTIGTITYQHFQDGTMVEDETNPLTPQTWDKLIKGLKRCEVLDWLDDYTEPGVMDGTNWSIEIDLPYERPICKRGSNDFPGRWKQFCRLLSGISGGTFE